MQGTRDTLNIMGSLFSHPNWETEALLDRNHLLTDWYGAELLLDWSASRVQCRDLGQKVSRKAAVLRTECGTPRG